MSSFIRLSITFLVLNFVLLGVYCQDVGFGQLCSLTNNCRSDFTCVNDRCQCRHPAHQSYDNQLNLCVSLVLGPCTDSVDGVTFDIPCVSNAECRNETGFPECLCRSGTRQNGRSCRAEFGQACKFNSDCDNPSSFSDNAVICKNERCDCGNLEEYDEASGRCIGLVGARCRSVYICVEGATCERFDSVDGICRCTGSFMLTPNRRCGTFQCPKL